MPDDPVYQPPIIIRCVEKKSFGRSNLIGATTIPSLSALVHREEEEACEHESEIFGVDDDDDSQVIAAGILAGILPQDSLCSWIFFRR